MKIPQHILGLLAAAATVSIVSGCGDEGDDPQPTKTDQTIETQSEPRPPGDPETQAERSSQQVPALEKSGAGEKSPDDAADMPRLDDGSSIGAGAPTPLQGGESHSAETCPACGMG